MINSTPPVSFISKSKDTHFRTQKEIAFKAFFAHPKTMLMVSIETGILRANLCRYLAEWERCNIIKIVRKSICPISKHRAGFYSTNPELFPNYSRNQLNLFD